MLIKVEDDYLQTNECDKRNTELKDNCKKTLLGLNYVSSKFPINPA